MAYLQILPFYPAFLRTKKIDSSNLGYLMSVFSFFFIISAFITGRFLLKHIKRIQGCFLGSICIVSLPASI